MRLYRAVSRGELSDIIEFQGFRAAPGTLETKLFATTAEDATSFARDLYPPDEPAAVILEVTISDSLAERLYYFQTDRPSRQIGGPSWQWMWTCWTDSTERPSSELLQIARVDAKHE